MKLSIPRKSNVERYSSINTSTHTNQKNTHTKRRLCYLSHDQFFEVWGEVIDDAIHSTWQSDATDKQDCQNHIREQCSEVHHLSEHRFVRTMYWYSVSHTHTLTDLTPLLRVQTLPTDMTHSLKLQTLPTDPTLLLKVQILLTDPTPLLRIPTLPTDLMPLLRVQTLPTDLTPLLRVQTLPTDPTPLLRVQTLPTDLTPLLRVPHK